ncbi:5'-3' exonuclease, N-terminal resolvase-like domain protein [Cellulomonas flavigena DSM 20109]|uniref:5'-3' exonuclease n=2 Tax=Cellulomonas flavigena TaxID=1711 RepID=D5ULY4_CELFN|nr:5'-3' exonuclease, N-terminal resolvase-like domain protein [Cellulomonas flavigena DSM 20109]
MTRVQSAAPDTTATGPADAPPPTPVERLTWRHPRKDAGGTGLPTPMTKTLLAVDGNSLIHRSFHALAGSQLRTRDGRPTWAVKGALAQVLGAVDRVGADAVVVGFDDAAGNVRRDAHPHYKAHRAEKPGDLVTQLALAVDVFWSAGLHVVIPDGLEADDVLASAASAATAAGWHTVVCTSDRDAFALVDETTSALRIINGGVEASPVLTPERLRILTGIDPWQYRQYAAMRGDASDNLTGIRGVGPKTAVALLNAFGSVDAAFADVDTNGGARVAEVVGTACVRKLADPEGRARFWENVELMTMRTDLDLEMDLTAASGPGLLPVDPQALQDALADVEFGSLQMLAARLLTSTPVGAGGDARATPVAPWDEPSAAATVAAAPAEPPVDELTLF